MAYNKAKAEKEWLRWKEVEEKKLRELGVDEETIQRLIHTIGLSLIRNASICSDRWIGLPMWIGFQHRIWNYPLRIPNPCWIVSRTWNFFLCYILWTSLPSKFSL